MKKFKLTDEFIIIDNDIKLYRIECIEAFGNIKVGDKGGFIQSEGNLSDNAWVYENARIYENACVYGNARIYGNACVYGRAHVYENTRIYENACVYGYACVYGNACVSNKPILNLNCIYNLTLTNNHISYGCIQKTIKEWKKWLKSDEVIETKRTDPRFKLIKQSLKLAIEYSKQRDN